MGGQLNSARDQPLKPSRKRTFVASVVGQIGAFGRAIIGIPGIGHLSRRGWASSSLYTSSRPPLSVGATRSNGWHRLLIVIAAAWALAITSLATVEYQASQGELSDGFFTCGEPARPPIPPTTRYCGLFPRTWVSKGLFDDLPPYTRSLNGPRYLVVLLGPPVFVGLCVVAICWVAGGFRREISREAVSGQATPAKKASGRSIRASLPQLRRGVARAHAAEMGTECGNKWRRPRRAFGPTAAVAWRLALPRGLEPLF